MSQIRDGRCPAIAAILAETGSFNGYLFRIDGSTPVITAADLGGETNTPEGAVSLDFTDQSVSINVAGLSVDVGSRIVVQLELAEAESEGE